MRHMLSALVMVATLPCLSLAQGTNPQVKTLVRPTVAITDQVYLVAWNITNIRAKAPDNTNIMLGLGVKGKTWWFDGMVWRQYALHTNQWALDFRFVQQYGKDWKIFLEGSPFLEQKAMFLFTRWDRRVGPLWLGVENENIHKDNLPDSLGIGPALTFPAIPLKVTKVIPTLAYQYRFGREPGFVRLYLVVPFTFD